MKVKTILSLLVVTFFSAIQNVSAQTTNEMNCQSQLQGILGSDLSAFDPLLDNTLTCAVECYNALGQGSGSAYDQCDNVCLGAYEGRAVTCPDPNIPPPPPIDPVVSVPEPSTLSLLGLGTLGMLVVNLRRRKRLK